MISHYGGIIKLNRIQLDLTIDYISIKTGISKSQISRIERNKEAISLQSINKIFSIMNINIAPENIDLQFEKDFQTFYSDVFYLKDYELSYKILKEYASIVRSTLSYIKYLLSDMIYSINIGNYKNASDYMYLEKYFDYLESYQIQLFYDYIGVIHYLNGCYLESCLFYNKALTHSGDDNSTAMVAFHKSISLTLIGELNEAFEYARKAREIFADNVNIKRLTSVNFQIARIYSMNGNYKKSEKLNLACIDAFTNLGSYNEVKDTYNNLIWNYIRANEFDKILSLEDTVLKIMNEDHCIFFYLSYTYYKMGDLDKAQNYILKAKDNLINPTSYMKTMISSFKIFLSDSSNERKEKNLIKTYNVAKKSNSIDLEIFTMELLKEFYTITSNKEEEYKCMKVLLDYYKTKK
ncbi:MAG: helix-turn-helix transcriptional regulator [Erysipelotrichaceae bacterium]|nr:helix-turn-helix transcriptional regulator [Erysipelotrichaceae bacterium]